VDFLLRKIVVLFSICLMPLSSSFASDLPPDIRYRSIVYFYPGKAEVDISVAQKKFKDFKFVDKFPESAKRPLVSISRVVDVEKRIPVPDLNYLSYFGVGLERQQAVDIQKSEQALVIDVAYPESMNLKGLKSTVTSLFQYAQGEGALLWDSETRELFTAEAWKDKRIDSWVEDIPKVEDHIVIHAYKNNDGVRAITLGMAKLGLPDVVVNDFSWSLNQPMGNLLNLTTQLLLEGALLDKQGYLAMPLDELKNRAFKQELKESLHENALPNQKILTGEGKWEEGDPENYILELLFDDVTGGSLSEKQQSFLSGLFGWSDQISYVEHNREIEAASERAKSKLNGLRSEFNKGLAPGEFIQLKAPFATPDGGSEWMWVEVRSWVGSEIKGLLKNEPYHIPGLKGGSEVTVRQEDIFDYIRRFPDGSSEGNETGALILKYQ